jgi:exodeoxyribonuclease-3
MRIATWNVNSLKARLDKLVWWVERASPDVLLLQETRCPDADAPIDAIVRLGYQVAHHGSGGRNGVAIASRDPLTAIETNFGVPSKVQPGASTDEDPLAEPRIIVATTAGLRVASVYAPNGRVVDSPFYAAKLAWFDRLARWLEATPKDVALVMGGDFNVAPTDADVWDPRACHGGTHVTEAERAAFARLCAWGFVDAYRRHHPEGGRYSWWDYRAGDFHRNIGMRIDHLLVAPTVAPRTVAAEIDREARKGRPTPSDHAPVTVDLDTPGRPFDAGWAGADERIAARRQATKK